MLDLVLRLIEEHIAITAEERVAVALWLFAHLGVRPIPHHATTAQSRLKVASEWAVFYQEGGRTERAKRWNPI
jgi:hypothetical protein